MLLQQMDYKPHIRSEKCIFSKAINTKQYFFFTFPYYITLKDIVWLVTLKLLRHVVFFYKVVNNHVRLTLDSRVRFSTDVDRGYALRSMDTANLLISLSRTNLFK